MNGYIPYITTRTVGDIIRNQDQGISLACGQLVVRMFKQVFNTTRYTMQNYNNRSTVTIQAIALTKTKLGKTINTPDYIDSSNKQHSTTRGYN